VPLLQLALWLALLALLLSTQVWLVLLAVLWQALLQVLELLELPPVGLLMLVVLALMLPLLSHSVDLSWVAYLAAEKLVKSLQVLLCLPWLVLLRLVQLV
jgi:hypothetical protein